MAYKLQLKRGLLASLPNGSIGEPLFTTDTFDLYVGKGDGTNIRLQKFIASGSSSQFLKGDGSLDSNTYIGLTALSASSPLSYNNTTGAFSISQASGSTNGYLSSGDWTTFNAKQAALSGSGIVKSTGGTISYLTDNSANWDTAYNDKINSASVSGTTTKTLTLTQQDGGTITTSWSDYDTAPVTSVFGRTGAVVAANGDYTTSQVTEGTNLYYTDARARAAITLTTTGSSGASTYVGGTLNIPTYTLAGLGGVASSRQLNINGTSYDLSADRSWSVGTVTSVDMSVPTGFAISGNPITSSGTLALAFAAGYSLPTTSSQANWDAAYNDKINSASVTGTTTKTLTLNQQDGGTITASWTDINTDAVTSVFGRTGAVVAASGDYTTTQVTEGTNLYYTEARVSANTDVAANTAARHSAVTIGTANGLSLSTQQLSLGLASVSTTGALSSTDWTTFNSKQAALNGTGFVKISGTTISYDNSTYYLASNPSSYIAKTDLSAVTPLSYDNVTGVFQMTQANSTTSGYITSTDWNTFNNKQSALTNPVTGTGTTNYLPKFTGSTTIGNSLVYDNGSVVTIGTTTNLGGGALEVQTNGVSSYTARSSSTTGASGGTTVVAVRSVDSSASYWANAQYNAWQHIFAVSGSTEAMRLTSTGLGIGTTTFATDSKLAVQTSGGKFDVRGIGVASIVLESNGGMHYNAPTGNFHKFQINNSTLMELNGSGNLGLGVVPSAWSGLSGKVFEFGTSFGDKGSIFQNDVDDLRLMSNVYFDGSFRYARTGTATIFHSSNGSYKWSTAPSGTAGNAISFTQAMTLDASGRLSIGNTSVSAINERLNVTGNGIAIEDSDGGREMLLGHFGGADGILGTFTNDALQIRTNNTARLTIASTGAATFSSSVTATQYTATSSGGSGLRIYGASGTNQWDMYLNSTNLRFSDNTGTGNIIFDRPVGIGTTAPGYTLDVSGTGRFTGAVIANSTSTFSNASSLSAIFSNGGSVANYNAIELRGGTAGTASNWQISKDNTTANAFELAASTTAGGTTYSSPVFKILNTGAATFSSSVTAANITSTTAAQTTLTIASTETSGRTWTLNTAGTTYGSGAGSFVLRNNGTDALVFNSSSAATFSSSVTAGGIINAEFANAEQGVRVTSTTGTNAAFFGANNGAGAFYFGLDNSAGTSFGTAYAGAIYRTGAYPITFYTNATERMRITSGGVVCINTTSASPGQNNSDTGNTFNAGRFFFNNSGSDNIIGRNTNGILISWRRAGVEVGTVDVTTTSTTYNTSSDYRLKTDFKDFSGIDLVGKIKAYDYEWKSDKTRSYGVIAHELQSVIGYAVTGEKDGERMQGVDYSKIVPVLIKAIQELKAEIDILKNK